MCICSEKWLYSNKYDNYANENNNNDNEKINNNNNEKINNDNEKININEKYNLSMYEPSDPIIYGLIASYLDDLNNQ